ncbi:9771_t:CDS:2 [Cetraspora pellucida]|uniref:9771_t:CDS:1 n=1 Tax=Cetraspora pellucida TaxID=1433469 RepID=A0A9N9E1B2_9GLOM|nr:9771_t:CDS:2 [Cetraspora pellucida]
MTDSKEADPLQLLKRYTAKNLAPQLVDENYNVVYKLQDAKYIQFGSLRFDKSMNIPVQGLSQQRLPLSVLYHAITTRDLDFAKYNEDATNEKFPERLSCTERKQWLSFICRTSNDSDKNLFGKTSEKRKHDNSVDNDHQNALEIKKARFNEDKVWVENYLKKHQAAPDRSWEESLESKNKDEDYSDFIHYADLFFNVKNRDLSAQQKPGRSRTSDLYVQLHYRLGPETPKNPLILVPPSPSAFITMHNVKQLLQDTRFEDQTNFINQRKENRIQIYRNERTYDFTDSVDELQQSDWNRVVCIITDGSEWVFKKYLWKTPQETFKHGKLS